MRCEIGGLVEAQTWFTSDTHLGHANIIKYCKRPFGEIQEMDRQLIHRWNSVVGPNDVVFHLGDFCLDDRKAESYRSRLNGVIHFIWGNHDKDKVRQSTIWASSGPYREIVIEGQAIVLFHYGMRVWNESHRGALHFYGHSHSNLPGDSGSVDVGVDFPAWNYTPVRLRDISRVLRTQTPRQVVDHHGRKD